MSLPDFLLEISRVLIGLGLAVFIGVPVALLVGRRKKIFLEGEEREGEEKDRFGRARFVAAGALLLGVLLEVQVMGSALPPRHVWRAGILFLLIASLVYSVMVVAPKARYYDERSFTFEENLRAAWHARRDAARARGSKIDFLGFLLAFVALVLG
jgi:MFS family permease